MDEPQTTPAATESRDTPSVRHEWLDRSVHECQVFAGEALFIVDTSDLQQFASALAGYLPEPRNYTEELLLERLLIEICARLGRRLHDLAHRQQDLQSCGFVPCHLLDHFWQRPHQPAKRVFLQWADAYARGYAKAHPASAAQRAAAEIRRRYARRWDSSEWASATGTTVSQLRRQFRRDYGVTMLEYHTRVRILKALEDILRGPSRIDSVARAVGYQSKKNFYRAFRDLIGLTPKRFSRLVPSVQLDLLNSMRLSLVPHNPVRKPDRW